MGTALIALLYCGPARGTVDLEWRPATQVVHVGDTVHIELYAVSSNGVTIWPMSAMDVLIKWDATTMELLGVLDNGPYAWFQSSFPDDSALDGLNNTWADGDAKYTALSHFGNPALATPGGLLVNTFEFIALQATPANQLTIPPALGQYSRTVVFGTAYPGHEITGALGGSTIIICAETTNGDMNADGSTDGRDIADFSDALISGSTNPLLLCAGDFSGNGVIDIADLPDMVTALLAP
jgi:hypothetical protein